MRRGHPLCSLPKSRDVCQYPHRTSEVGLPELTQKASAATGFTLSLKHLKLAKAPDGRRPISGVAAKILGKYHEQTCRFAAK